MLILVLTVVFASLFRFLASFRFIDVVVIVISIYRLLWVSYSVNIFLFA